LPRTRIIIEVAEIAALVCIWKVFSSGISFGREQEAAIIGQNFKKNNRGRHPLLHRFQAISRGYGLDPFQVCELLRLQPVPNVLLRKFRSACREEGVTPLQALPDFMSVYSK
jgi:hypothetical protein